MPRRDVIVQLELKPNILVSFPDRMQVWRHSPGVLRKDQRSKEHQRARTQKKNHLHSSQELKTRYCQTRTYAHQPWVLVGKEEEPVFHRLQLNSQSGTSDVAATD